MHFSARKTLFGRLILICFFSFAFSLVFLLIAPKLFSLESHAQTTFSTNSFASPNTDPNVPLNQHTYVQSIMIEILSSAMCQLTGVDPIDPALPCLDIDTQTHKLGFLPSSSGQAGAPHVRGLLGATSGMIAALYTPTIHSSDYVHYMADNFGIVKHAYAADGFTSLSPLLGLWKLMRNIAYSILVIAFIVIGIGIMLRIKIDPRTVMTIQNQIPRVIIGILLITLSYAIAAFMVDLMWVATYVGINMVNQAPNGAQIAANATKSVLQTPITYVNQVFSTDNAGLFHIADSVSKSIAGISQELLDNLFHISPGGSCFKPKNPGLLGIIVPVIGIAKQFDFGACVTDVLGFFIRILMELIIICVVLVTLFRVWFELLKAYVYVLIYTITAPIWIVLGIFPGRPLGFEKWIRSMFVNLAVFPVTAFLFVIARLFMDLFKGNPNTEFIPPLVGQPNIGDFGTLIAFGLLLMAPTVLNMLRDSMKVPGSKHGAAIAGGLAAGAAAPRVLGQHVWQRGTRVETQDQEVGYVRKLALGEQSTPGTLPDLRHKLFGGGFKRVSKSGDGKT